MHHEISTANHKFNSVLSSSGIHCSTFENSVEGGKPFVSGSNVSVATFYINFAFYFLSVSSSSMSFAVRFESSELRQSLCTDLHVS